MSPTEALNAALIRSGLSQKELAEKVGLTPMYINDMKMGRRGTSIATAKKLFDALPVTPEEETAMIVGWSGGWVEFYNERAGHKIK